MVARIKSDMDKVERQLGEAEATVETTMPAPALRSFVPYIFVSLFTYFLPKKLSRCPKLDGYAIANFGVRVEQGSYKF